MEPVKRTIPMSDGVKLFTQVYERGSKVWLIATHGIGEHLDRHSYLKSLFGHSVNIFQYDLRGHGRSGGEKAYVSDFNLFYKDLYEIIEYLKEKYQMKEYILFGHSMGALITCGFIKNYNENLDGMLSAIINAPPVAFPGALGKVVGLIPDNFVSQLASYKASLPLSGLVDLKYLSHNQEVKENYLTDQLIHLKLHSKLLLELVKHSREVFSTPLNTSVNCYCSYGSMDGIINPEAINKYFNTIEMGFTVTVFDGAYHEIHHELDKYRIPYFEYLKSTIRSLIYIDQEDEHNEDEVESDSDESSY